MCVCVCVCVFPLEFLEKFNHFKMYCITLIIWWYVTPIMFLYLVFVKYMKLIFIRDVGDCAGSVHSFKDYCVSVVG